MQVLRTERDAVNAHQGNRTRRGLQGRKLALGYGFFGHERQAKINTLQRQTDGVGAATINSSKRVYAAATQGEQINLNGAARRSACRIRQGEGIAALFYGETAAGLEESKHIKA